MPATPVTLAVASPLLQDLARAGQAPDVYVVGGSLRDALLHRPLHDLDLAAAAAPAFAARCATLLGTRLVQIDDRVGVYRLPLADGALDIAQLQGALATDLARRDFTLNALALPLAAWTGGPLDATAQAAIIDPLNGRADLRAGVIRQTGPGVYAADPIRLLRAVRQATELRFRLHPTTAAAIHAQASRLTGAAPDRVGQELRRLFTGAHAAAGARLLDAVGLLRVCFPPLEDGRTLEQRPHHRYPVLEHQLAALEWLDRLLTAAPPPDPALALFWHGLWSAPPGPPLPRLPLRDHLAAHALPLRLATLLHDVAKPATLSRNADGHTHFYGHPEQGAVMAAAWLRHWRFPAALVDRVARLVAQHLRPGQVAAPGQPPTDRALYRFHRALGDAAADCCLLFLADALATAGPAALAPRWPAYIEHVRRIIEWRPVAPLRGPHRLLTGRDVLQETGWSPGPPVGRILAAVEEAVGAGEVRSRDQALALVRRLAAGSPPWEGGAHG